MWSDFISFYSKNISTLASLCSCLCLISKMYASSAGSWTESVRKQEVAAAGVFLLQISSTFTTPSLGAIQMEAKREEMKMCG